MTVTYDANFDTFFLYYSSYHEGEFSLRDMKDMLLTELGEEGLKRAVAVLREKRLAREATGVFTTLYRHLKVAASV
jgi:hypothetical protein